MDRPHLSSDTEKLFKRLRRVGWVILGDPVTTNIALDEVIGDVRDKLVDAPLERSVEIEMFSRAVREFEATLNGRRRVQFLENARQNMPDLANQVRGLTINERLALALIEVESFSISDASEIAGRPGSILSEALKSAGQKITPNAHQEWFDDEDESRL